MSVDGKWNISIKTPMGDQTGLLTLKQEGDALNGTMEQGGNTVEVQNGRVEGETLMWTVNVTSPMPVQLDFNGKVDGDTIGGDVKLGAFGNSTFSGTAA